MRGGPITSIEDPRFRAFVRQMVEDCGWLEALRWMALAGDGGVKFYVSSGERMFIKPEVTQETT